ncbi:MAG: glycosyltransferase family 9 protein [Rhodospirillaceae bacterium]
MNAPQDMPTDETRSAAWRSAERILCVRLDNMGDVLMTTPALRALKTAAPARHITLLAAPGGAAVTRYIPEIDSVVEYEAPWVKQPADVDVEGSDELIDKLYAGMYDAAVIFTVYSQSALPAALMCWLARIPLRLAYSRENPYQLLTDWVPDPEPHALVRHETQRQLDLVASVGCTTTDTRLSFRPSANDRREARTKLAAAGINLHQPWIVVHPGASAASRRYPVEHYARAVAIIGATNPHQFVITGTRDEAPLAAAVANALPGRAHALAGVFDLGELGAVLEGAQLVICNNTGPAHIAAAVGTPVIDLYALTNPQHAPWQIESRVLYHDVPCRFCYRSVCVQQHHDCLRQVTPGRVAEAAMELLARQGEATAVATHTTAGEMI